MMLDPAEPLETRVVKQAKIIDALIRRSNRQKDVGPSAFRAFQSAIELQERVEAQRRDLQRAETELESARYERERTRRSLVEALSSMAEGFALFLDGQLHVSNDLLATILPDASHAIVPGLRFERFFDLLATSENFVSADRDLGAVAAALSRARNSSQITSVVIELREDRWYQLNAQHTARDNVVLLLTEISDLVRRNRNEKETLIDLQEDYLQAVFQNMSSGVCTFAATGEIMMHNVRFREILAMPASALKPGITVLAFLTLLKSRGYLENGRALRVADWQKELRSLGRLQKRVRLGTEQVLDIQANKLPDNGYVVELKDATLEARTTEMLEKRVRTRTAELTLANEKLVEEYRRKARVEEELRLAKERAEAAVSSKTRFLAAASHDLLQPINAAKLLISTLQATTRETEFSPMVERLNGAFGSIEQLLHSLLDISRLESADADAVTETPVSLGALMGGVHGDQALVAEQKGVRLDFVPSSAFVLSDPVYLLRSVQNLVVNAIQYTEPGGRVLVGCRKTGPGKVEVQVWDTGIGIAARDQTRIFDEFTRAEGIPLGTGMGLGLSVVDRACRLLGHKLAVRSKPGVGSVFSIEMDVVAATPQIAEPAGLLPSPNNEIIDQIIMVIENDEDVLYGATRWLEQMGASVIPAHSTEEAMGFVKDAGIPPDLILADYQLDGDDTGIAAIRQIRDTKGQHVPAILITADRSERVREAGLQNDVSVMTKPVKLARLRQLIGWKLGMVHAATG